MDKEMTLYEDLQWRGLIKDLSSEDLIDKLNILELILQLIAYILAITLHFL